MIFARQKESNCPPFHSSLSAEGFPFHPSLFLSSLCLHLPLCLSIILILRSRGGTDKGRGPTERKKWQGKPFFDRHAVVSSFLHCVAAFISAHFHSLSPSQNPVSLTLRSRERTERVYTLHRNGMRPERDRQKKRRQ